MTFEGLSDDEVPPMDDLMSSDSIPPASELKDDGALFKKPSNKERDLPSNRKRKQVETDQNAMETDDFDNNGMSFEDMLNYDASAIKSQAKKKRKLADTSKLASGKSSQSSQSQSKVKGEGHSHSGHSSKSHHKDGHTSSKEKSRSSSEHKHKSGSSSSHGKDKSKSSEHKSSHSKDKSRSSEHKSGSSKSKDDSSSSSRHKDKSRSSGSSKVKAAVVKEVSLFDVPQPSDQVKSFFYHVYFKKDLLGTSKGCSI